jgi:hypothetical protein
MTMVSPAPPTLLRRPSNGAPSVPAKPRNHLAMIDVAKVPPDRIIINAVEGWGKTSILAHAPGACIIMARGETGYPTLLKAGLVPPIPAVEIATWAQVMDQLDWLATEKHDFRTIGLDALGGLERLCHEHVCARDFGGDWGDKGFQAYMRGYDVSVSEWLLMLQKLDRIRSQGVGIVLLSHAKAKTFKNPLGPDFDRYSADCHEKTWAATAKWADDIFFGTFNTIVLDTKGATASATTKGRKKGAGGDERVIFTQRRDAYDAKNRWGMEPEILMPNKPHEMWATLTNAMTGKPSSDDETPPV